MLKVTGHWVKPAEIEAVLASLPKVTDALWSASLTRMAPALPRLSHGKPDLKAIEQMFARRP